MCPECVSVLKSFLSAGLPGWAELRRTQASIRLCHHPNDPEGWARSCEMAAYGQMSPGEIVRMRACRWNLSQLDLGDCDAELQGCSPRRLNFHLAHM